MVNIQKNVSLGAQSWFRCGGDADAVFTPDSVHSIQDFLNTNNEKPITILGGLANTIIRDSGVRGTVVHMSKAFSDIAVHDTHLKVQAGALNGSIAAAALKNNIGGLEFLSGIPGTLGGAVTMNAGAYGTEMKDVLVSVDVMDMNGTVKTVTPHDLDMTYRHTNIDARMIVIGAVLKGVPEPYDTIKTRLTDIKKRRNTTQPIKEKTGGSTFANPTDADLIAAGLEPGTRAWQIVDRVGGRDLKIGGAMMSEKHGNFMVNTGDATASDLEALGDDIIRRAQDKLGLTLRWEIKRIGDKTCTL